MLFFSVNYLLIRAVLNAKEKKPTGLRYARTSVQRQRVSNCSQWAMKCTF